MTRRICTHLREVSKHAGLNKMKPRDLAVSFRPVLCRAEEKADMRANIKFLSVVVQTLMNLDWAKGSGVL